MWLFPQYVTDALTRQEGLCPQVFATFGLYMSVVERDPFAGLVGRRYVLFEAEVEPGVAIGLDKPFHELPLKRCGVTTPTDVE
jgi:hypothetical protein